MRTRGQPEESESEIPQEIYERSLLNLPSNYIFPSNRVGRNSFEIRMFQIIEHFYCKLIEGGVKWPSRKRYLRFAGDAADQVIEDEVHSIKENEY